VIDLDAAMRKGDNRRLAGELCVRAKREHGMKVRVGGGIGTVRAAEQLIRLGVAQIIVGTAAFRKGRPNLAFLKRLRDRVKKKQVLIALDTAKGKIVVHGWRTSLRIAPREVMAALEPYCGGFLCTDVDREGTMSGVNLEWFRDLRAATKLPIVAAGGISSRREIRALEKIGMDSAVGMALYKNRVR
jgi:phosphoribosylformimino-5-aminoimidazole carboxamide ribotide isomerase